MPSFAERYIQGITGGLDIKRAQQQAELMDLKMLLAREELADIKASRKRFQDLRKQYPEAEKAYPLAEAGMPWAKALEVTGYKSPEEVEEEHKEAMRGKAVGMGLYGEKLKQAGIPEAVRPFAEMEFRETGVEKGLPSYVKPYLEPPEPTFEEKEKIKARYRVEGEGAEKDPMIKVNRQLETAGKVRNSVYRVLPTKEIEDPNDPTVLIKVADLDRATPAQRTALARADSLEAGAYRQIDAVKGYKMETPIPPEEMKERLFWTKPRGGVSPGEARPPEETTNQKTLISQYRAMLQSGEQTKESLLKDLEESEDYYMSKGIDINEVKRALGL